ADGSLRTMTLPSNQFFKIHFPWTSPAHNNSLASGGGLVLMENFVTLILLVQWDGAQVVNPRPIAKPKR
ncbi:MAG: hypothetical protein ACK5WF_21040, partial [Cyclobacteriaceae bacterium]